MSDGTGVEATVPGILAEARAFRTYRGRTLDSRFESMGNGAQHGIATGAAAVLCARHGTTALSVSICGSCGGSSAT